jgi:hypothetical protein
MNKNDNFECSYFNRSFQCIDEGQFKCIWVPDGAPVKCVNKESSCEALLMESACLFSEAAGSMKCIWVANEEEGYKCQLVKNSCADISRKDVCEKLGAAELKTEETTSALDCFWLYNGGESDNVSGNCREKNDSTLTCEEAKRSDQCTASNVDNFGANCIWLLEDSLRGIEARCEYKVF